MLNTTFNKNDLIEEGIHPNSGLPLEKHKAMVDYAKLLKKKHPQMKPERIARKVAEHFHVQVVYMMPAGLTRPTKTENKHNIQLKK